MHAVEIEGSIVDHRLEIRSNRLPANVPNVKVIVMVEEQTVDAELPDILVLAHAARASFPQVDPAVLQQEFAAMRDEWNARDHDF